MTDPTSRPLEENAVGPADRAIFDRMIEPYLMLDHALRVVFANKAWLTSFGESEATLGQCDHLIRALVANLHAGQRRLSPAFSVDAPEHAGASGEQSLRYWQIHVSHLPATGDEPPIILLRFDDVTMRTLATRTERREKARLRSHARLRQILAKEAEERLHDHRVRFERALAFAGVGAWEIDLASGAVHCSEQCAEDLALKNIGQVDRETLFVEQPDPVAQHWQALQEKRSFECERSIDTARGRRWVLIRGTGHFADDGTMRSVMGFTLDITSRKEHELELSATAGAERSGRERSEALARTMDHFIAAVSHELRSPLNAIVSWAELLHVVADPSHVARAGEAIRRNGRQLSHMVDDLLDSGAVVTGKLSFDLQPVDIGALTLNVVEDIRKSAEHKGLRLQTPYIEPCTVMADESRFKQVVWNLLTNAVKFTDAGSVSVSVRTSEGQAVLIVDDTGRGIAPDCLPAIFDRFQQIAPQSSGRVGGLGLGLWLVKNIVSLHGGTIEVASAGSGHGATFTVHLPLDSRLSADILEQ
ncbi:PAS/PAC sensor hybrid histidine kinase [Caballeronia fortuita]|uniref:histidine kinase n=1 Tax=Caballeronia fortuita TaxID=1777138 RepID=A0A158DY08_9BURK|nr:ATP-binding protein [Caballeronia fortuita]SAK99458.1 PAS/PAC sensor hybrid histidine kinase [Caballeronia fortuita]